MSNEYLERAIDKNLTDWKNDAKRKPLLLRGARQVGKSSTVRELGNGKLRNIQKHKDLPVVCG